MAVGDLKEIRVGGIAGADQINLEPEQSLEMGLQAEEAISQVGSIRWIKLVEEVDIALLEIKVT